MDDELVASRAHATDLEDEVAALRQQHHQERLEHHARQAEDRATLEETSRALRETEQRAKRAEALARQQTESVERLQEHLQLARRLQQAAMRHLGTLRASLNTERRRRGQLEDRVRFLRTELTTAREEADRSHAAAVLKEAEVTVAAAQATIAATTAGQLRHAYDPCGPYGTLAGRESMAGYEQLSLSRHANPGELYIGVSASTLPLEDQCTWLTARYGRDHLAATPDTLRTSHVTGTWGAMRARRLLMTTFVEVSALDPTPYRTAGAYRQAPVVPLHNHPTVPALQEPQPQDEAAPSGMLTWPAKRDSPTAERGVGPAPGPRTRWPLLSLFRQGHGSMADTHDAADRHRRMFFGWPWARARRYFADGDALFGNRADVRRLGYPGRRAGDGGAARALSGPGRPAEPERQDTGEGQAPLVLEELTRQQVIDWRTRAERDHQLVLAHIDEYGELSGRRLFTSRFVDQVLRLVGTHHLVLGHTARGQA
ncbi:hypothetical protein AB0K89_10830 [Streptomyces cinnamoneus]|uniref:hypothetical protein n=1 Tax=Streptomyces cinnamoneus TaxID=53446 RepID=UPI003434FA25